MPIVGLIMGKIKTELYISYGIKSSVHITLMGVKFGSRPIHRGTHGKGKLDHPKVWVKPARVRSGFSKITSFPCNLIVIH